MEDKKTKVQGAKKIEDAVTAGRESVKKTAQARQKTVVKAAKAGKENAEKAEKARQETLKKAAMVVKDNAEKAAKAAKAAKAEQEAVEKAAKAAKAEREAVEKAVNVAKDKAEKAAKAAKAERETVEKAAKAAQESTEKAATAGADALSSGYDRYLALTREQLEKILPEAVGKFDDFANFGKGTADAFFKAGDIAAKALESIGDEVAAYNRKVWDDGIANTKALIGCKTFEDVVELQTTVARAQFENFVSDTAKFSKLSLKAVNQTLEPIGG